MLYSAQLESAASRDYTYTRINIVQNYITHIKSNEMHSFRRGGKNWRIHQDILITSNETLYATLSPNQSQLTFWIF